MGIERKPLNVYKPTWEGVVEGAAVNIIKRNLWRVVPLFEFDDAYQEAYVVFLTVAEKYPRVTEAKHFMALFTRSLANHFHHLAKDRTRRNPEVAWAETGEGKLVEPAVTDEHLELAELRLMIQDAPRDIRSLFKQRPRRGMQRWHKEPFNRYLCRLAQLRCEMPKFDLRVNAWLNGDPLPP